MYSYEQTRTGPLRSKHVNYGLNRWQHFKIYPKMHGIIVCNILNSIILHIQIRMLMKLSLHQTHKGDCHHTPPHDGT